MRRLIKKFCSELSIEQNFCPLGDHRGCGLVERTIQTKTKTLGNVARSKVTIDKIFHLQNNSRSQMKQTKNESVSPFQAHFERSQRDKIKITKRQFLTISDRLDKENLEQSALTALQLKILIDQSRDNVKIGKKGNISKDTSPMFKQQLSTAKDNE